MSFKYLFKRTMALILVLIIVFSAVGCTQKPIEKVIVEGKGDVVEEIKVIDHLGREVVFERPAEKIVSGYYITSSMLIALGLEDKVVGIEGKPQSRPIYKLSAPRFLELPTVGTMKEFDLEGTASLNPDLVILSTRLKDSVDSLEKLGIKVIAVNPESMEELVETLDMIGKATGTEDRVNKLKSYYDEKTEEMKKIVANRENKSVYFGGNSDFLSTASAKMYQNTLITNAGGINVAKDIEDTYWSKISYEQLINYNPDVIIGAAGASYTVDEIKGDDKLKELNAIKNDEVYVIPNSFELWDSPIPSGIIGTMWLTSVLHQEVYPFDEFKEDVYEFYKEFYDIEINRDDITR